MIAFVNQPTERTAADRPCCPKCGTRLIGWIAHNQTQCSECKSIVPVKWLGRRLIVEGQRETHIDPHSQNS